MSGVQSMVLSIDCAMRAEVCACVDFFVVYWLYTEARMKKEI